MYCLLNEMKIYSLGYSFDLSHYCRDTRFILCPIKSVFDKSNRYGAMEAKLLWI